MIRIPLLYLLYLCIPLSLKSQGLNVTLSKSNKDCFFGAAAITINSGASPFQVAWSNARAHEVLGDVPLNRSIFNTLRSPDFIQFAEAADRPHDIKLSLPNRPNEIFEVLMIETSED